ncbi:unnamed protein product [Calicophoron daubneyi]|uniref:SCP domain-containing protein n=1 Tax=Calicophoron daubneyi TaxID=300641 RepID=A0AAV2TX03_CALDB
MTEDKKRQLLDLHNELRDKIRACEVEGQPPAKQMGSLVWNEQLANKAQNLADQCRVGHDSASDRQVSNWQWVGQNWAGSPDIQS